jgi:hypothetical protein
MQPHSPQVPQHLNINKKYPLGLGLGAFSSSVFSEAQTDTVHTVALISGSLISFTLEYMAEMTAAVGTDNLRSLHAKGAINMSSDSTRDGIKVCRPATAGLEFMIGGIQGCVAARAVVNASRRVVGIVFAGAGALGSLFAEDAELFCFPAWLACFP